jgi:hypothetical protein
MLFPLSKVLLAQQGVVARVEAQRIVKRRESNDVDDPTVAFFDSLLQPVEGFIDFTSIM